MKYSVSVRVIAYQEVEVEAESFDEAKEKVMDMPLELDLGDMYCIDTKAYSASDPNGKVHYYF